MIQATSNQGGKWDEWVAFFKLALKTKSQKKPKDALRLRAPQLEGREFCFAVLDQVSRSFAAVIRELPDGLCDPVCVFYLVLRGLDTVEDDMRLPLDRKLDLLRRFHRFNYEPEWCLAGVGDTDDYRLLLEQYYKVSDAFRQLDPVFQGAITQICRDMGEGMAQFAEREIDTMEDFDLYCHYVAGLVGIGLSELFSASGYEDPQLAMDRDRSNAMGCFLQKTNIIRDYHEDLELSRTFWPKAAWSSLAPRLSYFAEHPEDPVGLQCLNALVTDALRHIPDCLDYLARISHPEVFRFCAIPQVMAIATLAEVYHNPAVLSGVVKIRKPLAAKIMLEVRDMEDVRRSFAVFARQLFEKVSLDDPSCGKTVAHLQRALRSGRRTTVVLQDQVPAYS